MGDWYEIGEEEQLRQDVGGEEGEGAGEDEAAGEGAGWEAEGSSKWRVIEWADAEI